MRSSTVGDKAARAARQVGAVVRPRPAWVERAGRAGYLARGVVYAIVGGLAVQVALGQGGRTTDTEGALSTVAHQPFGLVLLSLLAVGLLGFAAWKLIQAWKDPDGRAKPGKSRAVARTGYAVSALLHFGLASAALRMVLGGHGSRSGNARAQAWTARLMEEPGGRLWVAVVGLTIAGYGVYQLYRAAKRKFEQKLELGRLRPETRTWVCRVSALGISARGVVFLVIGGFLVQAAARESPGRARGLDGALAALARQPHGDVLLGLVAVGLLAYAVYQFTEARFRRFAV
jgi:hypothetical protein